MLNNEIECTKEIIEEMERSINNHQITVLSQVSLIKLLKSLEYGKGTNSSVAAVTKTSQAIH